MQANTRMSRKRQLHPLASSAARANAAIVSSGSSEVARSSIASDEAGRGPAHRAQRGHRACPQRARQLGEDRAPAGEIRGPHQRRDRRQRRDAGLGLEAGELDRRGERLLGATGAQERLDLGAPGEDDVHPGGGPRDPRHVLRSARHRQHLDGVDELVEPAHRGDADPARLDDAIAALGGQLDQLGIQLAGERAVPRERRAQPARLQLMHRQQGRQVGPRRDVDAGEGARQQLLVGDHDRRVHRRQPGQEGDLGQVAARQLIGARGVGVDAPGVEERGIREGVGAGGGGVNVGGDVRGEALLARVVEHRGQRRERAAWIRAQEHVDERKADRAEGARVGRGRAFVGHDAQEVGAPAPPIAAEDAADRAEGIGEIFGPRRARRRRGAW